MSELESTLVKTINPNKINSVVGTYYRYPSTDLIGFKNNYYDKLLDDFSLEQKFIFLLGVFIISVHQTTMRIILP